MNQFKIIFGWHIFLSERFWEVFEQDKFLSKKKARSKGDDKK